MYLQAGQSTKLFELKPIIEEILNRRQIVNKFKALPAILFVVIFSINASGCGFLLFGAGAAAGAVAADDDDDNTVVVEKN